VPTDPYILIERSRRIADTVRNSTTSISLISTESSSSSELVVDDANGDRDRRGDIVGACDDDEISVLFMCSLGATASVMYTKRNGGALIVHA
jgi:hypothetical protein